MPLTILARTVDSEEVLEFLREMTVGSAGGSAIEMALGGHHGAGKGSLVIGRGDGGRAVQ